MLAGKAAPLLFIKALALLTQLVSEVADHRRRLVTDLAPAECFRNPGQRFQLLADTEAVGRRGYRHTADAADPGCGRDVPGYEVITPLLDPPCHGRELEFQSVDDGAQALGVVVAWLVVAMEIADRRFQFRERCDPYPYHDSRVPNICLGVNTLTAKKAVQVTRFSPPKPYPHALFPVRAGLLQKADRPATPL